MIRAMPVVLAMLAFAVVSGCGRNEPAKGTVPGDKVAQTAPAPTVATQAQKASTNKQSELRVIFQHTPRKSVGKLVQEGSETPSGWQGGPGRTLSLELYQRESNISALLSGGKEGDTASAGK